MTQPYPPTPFNPFGAQVPVPPPSFGEPRQQGFFAPWVKWYSPDLWRDVGQRWRGINFWYLFVLLVVTWTAVLVLDYVRMSAGIKANAPQFVNQVPTMTITQGVVTIDRPSPYTIVEPQTGKPLIVFDTTGATTQPPIGTPSALVTNNAVIIRKSATDMQTTDLSKVASFQLDAKRVDGWIEKFRQSFLPVGIPLAVVVGMIWHLVQMLILGGIGSAIASSVGARLTFGGAMRLTAVVITPLVLIDTLLSLAGISWIGGCFWWLACLGVEIFLLVMAVRANAGPRSTGLGGFPLSPPGPFAPAPYPPPGSYPPPPPSMR